MRYFLLAALLLATSAHAAVTLTERVQINLLRGTTTIETHTSWDACRTRARSLASASTQTTGTATYTCQSERRQVIAVYSPNPVNCVVSAWSAWTPAQCTAPATQTRTRTIVTPAANGGIACPALTETQPCPAAAGTARLWWDAPTTNSDGTALSDLAGYRIVYGRTATELAQVVQIPAGLSAYQLTGLAAGTWYFAIKAYASGGNESPVSNIVQKTVL